MSVREKIESANAAETDSHQDANTSNQPSQSDQEFFEDLNRKFEEKMIQDSSEKENVKTVQDSGTHQQQRDPTEADEEEEDGMIINTNFVDIICQYID